MDRLKSATVYFQAFRLPSLARKITFSRSDIFQNDRWVYLSKMAEKNEIVLKIEFIIVKRTDCPLSEHPGQRSSVLVHVTILKKLSRHWKKNLYSIRSTVLAETEKVENRFTLAMKTNQKILKLIRNLNAGWRFSLLAYLFCHGFKKFLGGESPLVTLDSPNSFWTILSV